MLQGWLAFLLVTVGRPIGAQVPYTVRHYTIRDGLAQGGAYYMIKDSRRYLWFMSQNGLTRFDGTRFVHYYSSKIDPASGPAGNTGSGLAEATNGDLWFGTEQCLNRYVRATNRFETVFARDRDGKQLSTLTHVFDADSTRIWYINEAEGLSSLNWHTGQRTLHSPLIRYKPPYDNEYIKHRSVTSEVWLLLPDDGVLSFNYQTGQTRSFFSRRKDNKAGPVHAFSALYLDTDGIVWLAHTDALIALNPTTGQTQRYKIPPTPGSDVVSAIEPDHRGNLWLATEGNGIYRFDKVHRRWATRLRHDPYNPASLSTNVVAELLIDPEGVIWVNTDPTGLDQLTPDAYGVRHYDVNPLQTPSLSAHTIWGVMEDRHTNVWIGTYLGGIDVLDPKTERIVSHYETTRKQGSLPFNSIQNLYSDTKGRIWVGAGSSFCRYDKPTDSFIPVPLIWSDSLPRDNRVVAMLELANERFFMATRSGLYQFNAATNQATLLADAGVWFARTLYYDRRTHLLYAGRRLRDLVCYELQGDSVRLRYKVLRTLNIQDISPDTNPDRLWVSTNNGLYLLRASDGKVLRSWNEQDGLPHRVVYSALADRSGLRWISTNRGMAVLDPRSGAIQRVQSIEPAEFNNSAYLLTRSGDMYFGSTTGLYRFNPLRQKPQNHALTVDFTSLLINDRITLPDSNLTQLTQLFLQPNQRTLTLQFGAVDYFSGGQNQYRYRLAGYDQNWVESGPINTTRYASLPPGDYVFEVLAADAGGHWMNHPRRLNVHVLPLFWQTTWFMGLAVLLVVSLLYGGFQTYLTGRLRRQRHDLQLQTASQQAERERLSRDLHDHIGPDLAALKLQLEAAREKTTDSTVDQLLSRLIGHANRIVTDVRQVSHALMPIGLQEHGLIGTLQSFIYQVNPRSEGLEISFTHAFAGSLSEQQQQGLLQIAKELINNSLKHAHASLIDVELYQVDRDIYLVISDNGRGYKLMSHKVQSTGVGLHNVQAVVDQLKGRLEITAKPTGGMIHRIIIYI